MTEYDPLQNPRFQTHRFQRCARCCSMHAYSNVSYLAMDTQRCTCLAEYDPLEPNRRAVKAKVGHLRDPCSRVLDKRAQENGLLADEGKTGRRFSEITAVWMLHAYLVLSGSLLLLFLLFSSSWVVDQLSWWWPRKSCFYALEEGAGGRTGRKGRTVGI